MARRPGFLGTIKFIFTEDRYKAGKNPVVKNKRKISKNKRKI